VETPLRLKRELFVFSKLLSPFFLQHVWRHKKYVSITSIILLGQVTLSVVAPLPLKFILDYVLGSETLIGPWLWVQRQAIEVVSGNVTHLIGVGAAVYFVAYGMVTLFEFLELLWLKKTSNKIVESTRKALFKFLTTRNFHFIDNQRKADLVGRLSQDTMMLQILLETGLPVVIRVLPSFVIIAMLMASTQLWFGLVILLLMVLMVVGSLVFSELIRKFRRQARFENTMLEQVGLQALQGYALTKSMKLEGRYRQKISRFARASSNSIIKAALAEGGLTSTMATIKSTTKAIIVLVGGILTVRGEFTVGGIVLFMSYIDTLSSAMKDLIKFAYKAAGSYASLDRIEELLESGADFPEPKGGVQTFTGEIRSVNFEKVSFTYPESEDSSVRFDGHFRSGQTYALMGASGSGKSTLLKILARFFDPSRGNMTFNGIPYGQLKIQNLLEKIVYVGQENFILSGTVRENLLFHKKSVSSDDFLWTALEKADVDHVIRQLPGGLNASIGDGGSSLSTGESRRICLARAFASAKPDSFFIFDEPTAGLDSLSRDIVIQSLMALKSPTATVVFTTHFEDEAALADWSLRMEATKIERSDGGQ